MTARLFQFLRMANEKLFKTTYKKYAIIAMFNRYKGVFTLKKTIVVSLAGYTQLGGGIESVLSVLHANYLKTIASINKED